MKLLPRLLAHAKGYWTAYLVLFVSLSLSVAGYLGHANYIRTREKARFAQAGRLAVEHTKARLAVYLTVMKGVRALFSASGEVTPTELGKYFDVVRLNDVEPNSGMNGIGVVWRVTPQSRSSHVTEMRRFYPDYSVSTGGEGTAYPIIHFESLGTHASKVLGWDASSTEARRVAIEQAEASGAPAMTAKIPLYYGPGLAGPEGFVAYVPIYSGTTDGANSRDRVIGHVFGAFDAKTLYSRLFPVANEITALEVFDGVNLTKTSLLFDEDGVFHEDLPYQPMLSDSIRANMFGRAWTFHFYTRQTFETSFERRLPGLMLALGTIGSFLLFSFVFTQITGRHTAEVLSENLSRSEGALRKANLELAQKVDESRASSEALSKSLSLHLATLESTGDGILVVDNKSKIVSYNRQFLRMWNISDEIVGAGESTKLIGHVLEQLTEPTEFVEAIKRLYAHPEKENCDLIYFKDGRIFERHSRPQRQGDEVIGRVMSFRDVTEQRRAGEKISAEKDRLAVTLRAISDAVVATDVEGRIVLMNPVAERMCGLSESSVAGLTIDKVFPLHDAVSKVKLENDFRAVLDGKSIDEVKPALLMNALGKQCLVGRRAAPTHDSQGHITGIVFVFRDVSQERKAEQELLRASKLESIGLLAGGIAHDFNNVLTGIVGNLSLLREYPGLSPEVSDRLALLEKSAYKARQLTLQLLTFAKGGSPIKQAASIVEVIRESSEFALRGSNLRAEFDFAPNLATVEIDTGQMSQVVQNLVINAKHAMPEGGLIRVTGINMKLSGRENLPLPKGDYVRVSIEDYGCGIGPEHISKIFDPYFTTKEKGSGLGLATAYSILKRHDGLITAESELGKGSVFHLYLPASNVAPPPGKSDTSIQLRGSASGRILAMDDEAGIRTLLSAILKHFGYETTTVADGAEAIREYSEARKQGKPYRAVIMDLTIPGGMGGKETIRALREIDPAVKAIVCSGYSNDPVLAEFQKYGFTARVEKPYRMQELGKVLRKVLATEIVV